MELTYRTRRRLKRGILTGLGITLAWKFRAHLQPRKILLPTVVYLVGSVGAIQLLGGIDLDALGLSFGVFLILLSAWFLVFSRKIKFTATTTSAVVCSAISGVTSGLFGIGGGSLISRLLGYGISLGLHRGMTAGELSCLIG